jgi:hypothetical protein
MNFLKNNSYDIVRFFINQMGIMIFSLVLYISCGFVEDVSVKASLRLAVSIGSTLFYFALLYYAAWECGAKDKVRIDSGRLKRIPFKGALMSLVANSLNIIIAISALICITVYINSPELHSAPSSLGNAAGILSSVYHFISAMFIGIANAFSSLAEGLVADLIGCITFIAMYLVTVAVTGFGYFMGVRDYRISSLFSFNQNKYKS